ncbi:hypothetical protein KDI99_gp28 [Arthrobacter phage Greenhouse]|uniref:Uncharacterized protein n=1 Tax=Arthrobacter phage Greenhouse TaxID=1897428 RepID=A0A1I9SE83_9CAUD|nr:hypothetical protein KDI99_gp28 [Arthrobacter phage Greenhouse]AOZ65160.1 hypothetical protein SEA_GREENHOUSE_28 [Arthrobacter phage Greenhouse]
MGALPLGSFSHYTKLALELSREDCGRVVSIGNGMWNIVGVLHRVDNEDIIESPGWDFTSGSRSIRCWVTVGPFRGEIDPRSQVIVEVPELPAGETGDVIKGEIVATATTPASD